MINAPCTRRLSMDSWFPESHQDPLAIKAQRICKVSCPVREKCEEAGRTERHGIWGGVYRSEEKGKQAAREAPVHRVMVSALGTRRRLQALASVGWASKDVSVDIRRYTGLIINPNKLDLVRAGDEPEVPKDVAAAVVRAVKHLGNRTGTGIIATTLMAEAHSLGWPTPRQWAKLDFEDPEVHPDVD
jgi:hypothetical protein